MLKLTLPIILIVIIFAIISVILFYYIFIGNKKESFTQEGIEKNKDLPVMGINWTKKSAKDALNKMISLYGKPSTINDNKIDGMAFWGPSALKENGSPLEQLIVLDEEVRHGEPIPHKENIYGAYKIHIPNDRIVDVYNITESIYYDRSKRLLWDRSNSIENIYATFNLVKSVLRTGRSLTKTVYYEELNKVNPQSTTYNKNITRVHIQNISKKNQIHEDSSKKIDIINYGDYIKSVSNDSKVRYPYRKKSKILK